MKARDGFDNVQAAGEREKLPAGGYIINVMNVELLGYQWGEVIRVDFDIADGEHKDFYKRDYAAQTGEDKKWKGSYRINVPFEKANATDDEQKKYEWSMRLVKRDTEAFEESNKKFHWDWDESKLKGLTVGAIFFEREWEFNGHTGFATTVHHLVPIAVIQDGKFKVPDPKLLNKSAGASGNGDFVPLPELSNDELPF